MMPRDMAVALSLCSDDERLNVRRWMRECGEPWPMAIWSALSDERRDELVSTCDGYELLARHWEPCVVFDCDSLATRLDCDGEFCCAAHVQEVRP